MNPVFTLIKPRLLSFRNRSRQETRGLRLFFFFTIGLTFWIGIYAVSHRVLVYFQQVEDFGDILAYKLLSMVLLTFFSLLIFSSILTSLSKLYLSKDLKLVHAMPVPSEAIFFSRWIESTVDSSWMVIVYTIPIFIAYGNVYSAGFFFYTHIAVALLPLCIIASALSAGLVLLAVYVLPASRMKSIFVFMGLVVLLVLYMAFRLLRPERLVDPESFASALLYLRNISMPASPLLPSTWAFDSLKAALSGDLRSTLFHSALSWSGAVFLALTLFWGAKAFYFNGYSKAQSAQIRLFKTSGKRFRNILSFLPGPTRAFLIKEIKTFWRDQTQWSQLFLIGALIIIYLYNFSVLPLDKSPIQTVYLQNLFSFLNMGLAAFVLTAVTARFAFPTVSIEGNAFWIVRSGPISIKTFLWIKFFIYLFPLLILAEVLIIATNMLLRVTPFIMYLSIITIFCITPGIIALGIGLGAAYPDFTSENPAQSVTSFGGLVFMILSAAFIGIVIILEAGPVYTVFMSDIAGRTLANWQHVWIVGSFVVAFIVSILAVLLPMGYGTKRLDLSSQLTIGAQLA